MKAWHDEAWEDYVYWQKQDKRTLKRINDKNRIVYRIFEDRLEILQCGSHYRDE
jgi:toxin YoeB